ncbi:MAG: hypothetical protein QOK15_1304, partial [Nocardioidaceae bacterium]|nr:hypothetical protein [Nocardioidaceae bacterium]
GAIIVNRVKDDDHLPNGTLRITRRRRQ